MLAICTLEVNYLYNTYKYPINIYSVGLLSKILAVKYFFTLTFSTNTYRNEFGFNFQGQPQVKRREFQIFACFWQTVLVKYNSHFRKNFTSLLRSCDLGKKSTTHQWPLPMLVISIWKSTALLPLNCTLEPFKCIVLDWVFNWPTYLIIWIFWGFSYQNISNLFACCK